MSDLLRIIDKQTDQKEVSVLTTESLKRVRTAPTAAAAAAEWWVAALETPRFESNDSPEMAAVATRAQLQAPLQNSAALEQFRHDLRAELEHATAIPEGYTKGYTITVSVDYNPQELLLECAQSSGLRTDMLAWPSKTVMKVNLDEVIVQQGWGDPVTVWHR